MKNKKVGVIAVGGSPVDSIQYELINKQFDCMADYLSWDMLFRNHIMPVKKTDLAKDENSLKNWRISEKTYDMKKRKLIVLAITIIAAALLLEGFILKYVNDKNSDRTSKVLLDRVITVLDKNDKSEEALIKSLKDDYIVRAKAVSYIIDAKPEVEYDVDELQKIAALISVDEIHLFDTKGYIYSGSVPKYFGYSFDSGEQMAYFKPMLKDKKHHVPGRYAEYFRVLKK